MKSLTLGCLLALFLATSFAADLPGDSIYRVDVSLQTASGTSATLASLRGRPLLVTLFYSQCSSVCPLVTVRLQEIDRHLAPQTRPNVRVLMLSLDSTRDTPQALEVFRQEHHIEDPRWIVARAEPADVRTLAAVLGVRYRELPDQSINHSAVIALVDRDGVIRARTDEVRGADTAFLRQVRSIAAEAETNPRGRERARPR